MTRQTSTTGLLEFVKQQLRAGGLATDVPTHAGVTSSGIAANQGPKKKGRLSRMHSSPCVSPLKFVMKSDYMLEKSKNNDSLAETEDRSKLEQKLAEISETSTATANGRKSSSVVSRDGISPTVDSEGRLSPLDDVFEPSLPPPVHISGSNAPDLIATVASTDVATDTVHPAGDKSEEPDTTRNDNNGKRKDGEKESLV